VGWWLTVLCFIFTVWNPASLALRLASTAGNVLPPRPVELIFLAARVVLTILGVVAGLALFRLRPSAVQLAKTVLVLFTIEAVVRMSTRIGLSEVPPGMRLPTAIFIMLHNGAWYFYLDKSRRVRALYGLESQRPKE
jgi:hypothetical protein